MSNRQGSTAGLLPQEPSPIIVIHPHHHHHHPTPNSSNKKTARKRKHATNRFDKANNQQRRRERGRAKGFTITILQWNADGISSPDAQAELKRSLEKHNIDICAIQETHLNPKKSIRFPGYNIERKDRTTARTTDGIIKGGGVITLIREDIKYSITDSPLAPGDNINDAISVIIYPNENPLYAFRVHNIYAPPIRTSSRDDREDLFNPVFWSTEKDQLFLGDFNAHHAEWDYRSLEDARGTAIHDWMGDNGFYAANDQFQPTFISRQHGTTTSPDVSIVPLLWEGKMDWSTIDRMCSDHSPIRIKYLLEDFAPLRVPRRPKWAHKKADWKLFNQLVDNSLETFDDAKSVHVNWTHFRDSINASAKAAIPKGRRRNPQVWWTDDVDVAVNRRNEARAAAENNPDLKNAWIAACEETRRTIIEAKEDCWRQFVGTLNVHTKQDSVWAVIRNLDGRQASQSSDKAIVHRGKTLISDMSKAKAFCREYADVSRLPRNKTLDREIKINLSNQLSRDCRSCGNDDYCVPFTINELERCIRQLAHDKAPGRDDITNDMLIALSETGKTFLLSLINQSWTGHQVPSDWRHATIIPILKKGKPPENLGSHRPISLTSCVAKLAERMAKNRLTIWAECNLKLSDNQAGFRKHRSTEDQVLKIAQHAQDGLRHRDRKRSILVLVDFSRAFDKVWKKALFSKLLDKGAPTCLIKWIKEFLRDRKACVRIGSTNSKNVIFREGCPQGAVLSPDLFLHWIDELATELELKHPQVTISLFADDLALISQDRNIQKAEEIMQGALDTVTRWARTWKMEIAAGKCDSLLISLDPAQVHYQPRLTIDGYAVPFNVHPIFLGISFDRQMTWRSHCDMVALSMSSRLKQLKVISGKSWGMKQDHLRSIFIAYIRAKADYCASVYLHQTASTNVNVVQKKQNEATRIITGCCSSTPIEALNREADLMPLKLQADSKAAMYYERAWRLPDNFPTANLVKDWLTPTHLQLDRNWRNTAGLASQELYLNRLPRAPIVIYPRIPFVTMDFITYNTSIAGASKANPPEDRKRLGQEAVDLIPWLYRAWTDGSAASGTTDGGWGAFIEHNSGVNTSIGGPAGALCSSFTAEMTAIRRSLQKILELETSSPRTTNDTNILLCTDSQSSIAKLSSGWAHQDSQVGLDIFEACHSLNTRHGLHIVFQWVPSHVGLDGNEAADSLAGQGSREQQDFVPIDFQTIKATIIRHYREHWLEDYKKKAAAQPLTSVAWHHSITGGRIPDSTKHAALTRFERVTLNQFRTGHCPLIPAYLVRIGKDVNNACLKCGYTPCDRLHILECPELFPFRIKREHFISDPARAVEYLRLTGLWPR
jgi:ribonuclease HI